jgi:hypothetical protein
VAWGIYTLTAQLSWVFSFTALTSNAGRQLLPKVEATEERTLEAVSCTPLLGLAWI